MFLVSSTLTGAVAPTEYYEVTVGEDLLQGQTLKISGGKLTKSSGTDKPEFICQGNKAINGKIPVIRITDNIEFETISEVNVADTAVGTKVTVNVQGIGVTATTDGGVFKISRGSTDLQKNTVRGYFI